MQLVIIKGLKFMLCVGGILTFNAYYLNSSHQIESDFSIPETSKRTFRTVFWVQNHFLNLCSSAVKTQRLFLVKSWSEIIVLKLFGIQSYITWIYTSIAHIILLIKVYFYPINPLLLSSFPFLLNPPDPTEKCF